MDFEGKARTALSKSQNQTSSFYERDYFIQIDSKMSAKIEKKLEKMQPFLQSVIIFVNPRSGGQKGRRVYEKLKSALPENNVFDLSQERPKIGLEKHKNTPDLKIIACGGDGTLGWVLSDADSVDFVSNPSVGIIPLGTGNDLSNILGWGTVYENESIVKIFDRISQANVVKLDRWSITATPNAEITCENTLNLEKKFQVKSQLNVSGINHYFSIGVDAKIALDSHEAREKNPKKFTSPNYNKIVYSKNFFKSLFKNELKNMTQHISAFECDGISLLEKIKKLNLHSILILNISSYSSGINPWKKDEKNFNAQSISDGKFEVIGFGHTRDLLLLRLGGKGISLAQPRSILIKTECPLPIQIDGEPILLQASEIKIEQKNQVLMFAQK
jgi:diacylglycerol kinase (ATP)